MTLTWSNDVAAGQGVRERHFALTVNEEPVSGALWTPPGRDDPAPVVLVGHGYGMSSRDLYPVSLATDLVARYGLAVGAIDLPFHGQRSTAGDARDAAWTAHWRRFGASRIAAEFCAVRDALAASGPVDASRVAFWGLSLGTQYGLGVLAAGLQARAAVLGLFGLPEPGRWMRAYAPEVTCPVFFIRQLEDELHAAERVSALFALLASPSKHMESSPGGHMEVPAAVIDRAYAFIAGHLDH